MKVLKAHPSVRKIIVESRSLWNPGESTNSFDLEQLSRSTQPASEALQLTQIIRRIYDTQANVDDFDFSSYQFPASLDTLHHVESVRMRGLQLSNCTNIGYLFNGLLCNVDYFRLKSLTIRQEGLQANTGYFGKPKIEYFLTMHRGLEEVEFTNTGESMPCLQAILA